MNPLEDKLDTAKTGKWYRFFLNKYLIVGVFFIVWMVFFDQNSYFIHRDLDKEIHHLNHDKTYYDEKLKNENAQIDKMKNDTTEIERIAREKHYLKKENEDVFIIEQQKVKKPTTDAPVKN